MNVLFNGCSLVDRCGFEPHNIDKLWVNLISDHLDWNTTNIGHGGSSNEQIMHRTINELSMNDNYDMVVVEWSSIYRFQLFRQNPTWNIVTLNSYSNVFDQPEDKKIHNLLWKHYNNDNALLNQNLNTMIMLARYIESLNIQYVFVRGFDNYISELHSVDDWKDLSDETKENLYTLSSCADDYINECFQLHKKKLDIISKLKWANKGSLLGMKVDLADDNNHPGPISNIKWKEMFVDYIKK